MIESIKQNWIKFYCTIAYYFMIFREYLEIQRRTDRKLFRGLDQIIMTDQERHESNQLKWELVKQMVN
ncbi:unnamed protein product [Paramecium octaurelia]|uniref:Uncharacterized protein n=1 Tax=Paramecium octaurelia TaxID=43137 RepID=A0A8S1X9E1_PAROT|nr:unnamed protein product [Paramecium octaurelia]